MRGSYHRLLVGLLLRKLAEKSVSQDSLGVAAEMHQTTISGILKGDKGTFDLDEASAMLDLIGSSLKLFVDDPEHVVTIQQPQRPKVLRQLDQILLGLKEPDQRIFLGLARGVRDSRRTGDRLKRRPVSD